MRTTTSSRTTTHSQPVTYPRKKVIAVLRTLNELVVSLDQIGSATYDMTDAEHHVVLSDFMRRHKMIRKLAQAREILSAAFSTELGADDKDELEREMRDIQYWSDRRKK